MLRDLGKALLAFGLLVGLKTAAEHTTFGQHLDLAGYNTLQGLLTAVDTPVAIVDISDLKQEEFTVDGRTRAATPRGPLREIMTAVATQGPRAIGIDIDFAPDAAGYIHPNDPEFFEFCRQMSERTGVPVFLGIGRTAHLSPQDWLGAGPYQTIAANILIPNDPRRMVRQIVALDPAESATPSKALSLRLSEAYAQESETLAGWFHRFREGALRRFVDLGLLEMFASRRLSPRLTAEDYLVDFASIGAIQPVETTDPVVLRDRSHRRSFNGKVVILGDITKVLSPREMFGVPNRNEPYPGTYVHAAAVNTLITAPLYAVTGFGRFAIDLFFCLVVAAPVAYLRSRSRRKASPQKFQALIMTAVIVGMIFIGAASVGATRVMWTDFILAFAVVVLHPSIERWLHGLWTRIKQATRRKKPRIALLVLAALAIVPPERPAAQDESAGVIVEIQGTVFLRARPEAGARGNVAPVQLDPKRDLARRVYAGDRLQCAAGAVLRLRMIDTTEVMRGPSEWTVPAQRGISSQARKNRAALDAYARAGGRDRRADPATLSWPSAGSTVVPARLVIRWNRDQAPRAIALVLEAPGGKEVWRQEGVDGSTGSLVSESARKALEGLRAGDRSDAWTLRLVGAASPSEVQFFLLSLEEEASLAKELAAEAAEKDALVRHFNRARVFGALRMFQEAAEEFEAALALAPESTHLLNRAVLAREATGEVERAEELRKRVR